ncbi:MazG nucleotide pyrophosphohydrolase domain-containing protein, partial [Staphylococcus aureus]
ELGDLLLQVVLQATIAAEAGKFSLTEVAQGITQKLIRRHPHVFGDVKVQSVDEVRQNWEQIKATEKGESASEAQQLSRKLSRIARTLPPLTAGMKISQK